MLKKWRKARNDKKAVRQYVRYRRSLSPDVTGIDNYYIVLAKRYKMRKVLAELRRMGDV